MKRPDFGDVFKIVKCFLQMLRACCLLQELKFTSKFLDYLTGHRWGADVISRKDHVSSREELGVLCDWYLSIIKPYLYSLLPENTIKTGRFIVGTLYYYL
jgi:hypothetical protein